MLLSNMSHGNILPPWADQATMYLPVDLPINTTSKSPVSTLQAFRASTIGFGANMTCTELSSSSPTDKLSFNISSSGYDIEFKATHFLTDGTSIDCFITGSCGDNDPAATCSQQFYTNGSTAMEAAQQMNSPVNDGGFCSSTTVLGWVRVSNGTTIPDVNATQPELRNVTQTFLSCKPQLLIAQYDVTVDTSGHVIGSNRISDFATDLEPYFAFNNSLGNINETHLWIQASANFFQLGTTLKWHNDSFTSEWFNSLLTIVLDSHELVDPSRPVPNPDFIIPHAEALYTKFFAVLLSLNQATFARSPSPVPTTVHVIYAETRIFVSPLMFQLCIIILSIQLIVAILFYVKRPKRFLPRMPTSIASIIAFVVSSRALQDFNGEDTSLDESDKKLKDGTGEQRYGYGRFVGTDRRTKVGIEKQRYVVPLEVENPHVKRRRWGWRFVRRDEKEVETWI